MLTRKSLSITFTVLLGMMLGFGVTMVAAKPAQQSGAPALISYQGFLSDSSNNPVSDGTYSMRFAVYDSSSGGTKIWEETQSSVAVANGFFSVLLGSGSCTSGCPLDAADFNGTTRYLATSIDIGGFIDFPRQQLASVPYALQAEEAKSAPWGGLTGVPPGFADGVDNGGASYENVITVAKSGGDFTSVKDALDATSTASSSNRYLVRVMPGTYSESSLLQVRGYVHLQGAGSNVSVIQSSRSATSPGGDAATVQLDNGGHISDLHIINSGTGSNSNGIGIYVLNADKDTTGIVGRRDTIIDNVVAEANGSGGKQHFGIYNQNSDTIIKSSTMRASGASDDSGDLNAAIGNFSSANVLIIDSIMRGEAGAAFGYGVLSNASNPQIRDSDVNGVTNAIIQESSGFTDVQGSRLSANNGAILNASGGAIQAATSKLIGTTHSAGTVTCSYMINSTGGTATCP